MAEADLLNTKLVREGYAGFDDSKDSPKYFDRLKKLQTEAKEAGAGVWGDCGELHTDEPEVSRCEDVSDSVQSAIAEGVIPETNATLRGFQAVKSDDFSNVWMVAADLEGPGLDGTDEIGVWATNSIGEIGMIMAVDGFAQEFSDWPDADSTDANITIGDDGVAEAIRCAKEALK